MRADLQANDANHDTDKAGDTHGAGGIPSQHNTGHGGPHGADPGPDGGGGTYR